MCIIKIIVVISILVVLAAIIYHSMTAGENRGFKDVGPFYSFGPENVGMYLMSQQRMAQGLDPLYATPLNPAYSLTPLDPNVNVPLLAANGVRPLETFVNSMKPNTKPTHTVNPTVKPTVKPTKRH